MTRSARPRTLSAQLSEHFTSKIRSGIWSADEAIPTEKELMREYRASRNTIRTALKKLEKRGWLTATQGSGRRVRRHAGATPARIAMLVRGGEFDAGQGNRLFVAVNQAVGALRHTLITLSINHHQQELASPSGIGLDPDQIDGVIVFARQYRLDDVEQLVARFPLVALTHDATSLNVPSFLVDYGYHAAVAVEELAAQGHRRIKLLATGSPAKATLQAEIRRGFDLGRRRAGLPLDPNAICHYEPAMADSLLEPEEDGESATAMVSYLDSPLADLTLEGRRRGMSDEQLPAMVCLADLGNVQNLPLPFTHFAAPLERIAREAVDCLHGLLCGEQPDDIYHVYYGDFVPTSTFHAPA